MNFMSAGGRRGCGELRPTKLSPAPQENVPAAPAPGPHRGQLALTVAHLPSHYVLRHSSVSDVARSRNKPSP